MLRTRIIPALLLHGKSLVKTERFGNYQYIGDPANTVRIFNELEVDELCFLDIKSARTRSAPAFEVLRDIATECFMPLSYGGGIDSLETAKRIFDTGFEKVILNTAAYSNPELVSQIAHVYGSQAVVVSVDVKHSLFGNAFLTSNGGRVRQKGTAKSWCQEMEQRGAGEILLTSVEREGTWSGFDLDLIASVSDAVNIPVIAHGGASKLSDLTDAVCQAGASAVAVGSMVVFQKKGMGVLVNFPSPSVVENLFPELPGTA
ncbi:AglZ/HisF2 family acetamidino modification protein [Cognatishimia sp. D5M38]|uniref:Imidazole glycerol phosphate synthase subunit HisF n=1 Tax=Cognatishimia coralii TaxID=3083254 RepID=A0ABU8QKW8_9RHOB